VGRSGRGRGASGLATVELVLILPLVFAIIMLAVQVGMWAHAAHVVTAAAQEGARAARAEDGSAATGDARARAMVDKVGSVDGVEVSAGRGADTARVEVRGVAVAVIPGVALPVRGVSEGPVERFRAGPGL
jgi:Flp pilus assembly protein TadG